MATMAGLDLNMPVAPATARDMGASGWAAAELLLALRMGVAAGSAARRTDPPRALTTPPTTDA